MAKLAKRLGLSASCVFLVASSACSQAATGSAPSSQSPGYAGTTAAGGVTAGTSSPVGTGGAGTVATTPITSGTGGPLAGSAAAGSGAAGSAAAGSGAAGSAAAGSGAAGSAAVSNGPFMSLAVTASTPLTKDKSVVPSTMPPAGWDWYPIENTFCRDGSGNGVYMHEGTVNKLLIYFEGGGACTTVGFCHFNPANVDSVLTGDGQSVLGTALATGAGRQQPGVYNNGMLDGIFAADNDANPYKGWSMVYIPYCTGDVHFGSNDAGMVPNLADPQKFVGYKNTREFMSHVVPTFKDKVDHVIVTGASAGSFGAALNFSMIADSFSGVHVDAVLDSGAPFEDEQWPACLQKSWRDLWKLNDSLPADCAECFNADGGGLLGLADYLLKKHPTGNIAAISSLHDEVIRLFFTPGENDCATLTTADPFEITTGQIFGSMLYPADKYEKGLTGVRSRFEPTKRMATYLFGGTIDTQHQHTFRPRFYENVVGGKSMAQFIKEFLDGTITQVGP